jgi:hypothetical protein
MRRFFYAGGQLPLPPNRGVLFVDGASGDNFCELTDLELSHWVPNRTPKIYKADTSTGICLCFVKSEARPQHDLVVNNHADVDGLLSAFIVCFPDGSKGYEDLLEGAARMGDFGAWCGDGAARLCFGLSLFRQARQEAGVSSQEIYEEGFERIPKILAGREMDNQKDVESRLRAFGRSAHWVESGRIQRHVWHEHFVHFHLTQDLLAENSGLIALYQAGFDGQLALNEVLPRQVRNRQDAEKLQLISVETPQGQFYDLMVPEYCWAETPHSWKVPGLSQNQGTNALKMSHLGLSKAVALLSALEKAKGDWMLAKEISPFETLKGRGFPVVLSFLQDGSPTPSSLKSTEVADILAEAFLEEDLKRFPGLDD